MRVPRVKNFVNCIPSGDISLKGIILSFFFLDSPGFLPLEKPILKFQFRCNSIFVYLFV